MRDDLLDLFLGSRCAGCGRPGRALCEGCVSRLPTSGWPAWPDPAPPRLLAPYAAGWYEPPLSELVIGLKERRQLALAPPLGRVLGAVVGDLVRAESPSGPEPVVLVPVPSSAAARRARGHDHTGRLALAAAQWCRLSGAGARVVRAVRHRGRSPDQAGLTRQEREQNAQGRFRLTAAGRAAAGRAPCRAVVVDDVLTTGQTLREVQSVLLEAGLDVLGAAVLAAVRRRSAARDPVGDQVVQSRA